MSAMEVDQVSAKASEEAKVLQHSLCIAFTHSSVFCADRPVGTNIAV